MFQTKSKVKNRSYSEAENVNPNSLPSKALYKTKPFKPLLQNISTITISEEDIEISTRRQFLQSNKKLYHDDSDQSLRLSNNFVDTDNSLIDDSLYTLSKIGSQAMTSGNLDETSLKLIMRQKE